MGYGRFPVSGIALPRQLSVVLFPQQRMQWGFSVMLQLVHWVGPGRVRIGRRLCVPQWFFS